MLVEKGKEEQGENERLTRKKLPWSRKNCDQLFKSTLKPWGRGREANKTSTTMKQMHKTEMQELRKETVAC